MDTTFTRHGFLPQADPLRRLGGELDPLDELGRDLPSLLEDKDVDAVFIATPDHWHAPATLLALSAGKHVYVEKPCSHTLQEGRAMVDAARKARRVVQVGTQSRSTEHVMTAMKKLHEGAIGEIRSALGR